MILIFKAILTFIIIICASAQELQNIVVRINQRKNHQIFTCTKFIFYTSYKRININIINSTNVRSILFSDSDLNIDCFEQDRFYHQCVSNGTICSFIDNLTNQINYETGFCIDKMYLYVQNEISLKDNQTFVPANIYIYSNYSNLPCNSILEDKYTKCGKINSYTCQNYCILNCVYTKCFQKNFQKQRFGLCLPINLTEQQYLERCQTEYGINSFNISTVCSKTIPHAIAAGKQNPLIAIIVIVVIVFLLSVLYYRFELKKTGRAPFKPPSVCPLWVYPKPPQNNLNEIRQ